MRRVSEEIRKREAEDVQKKRVWVDENLEV